MQELLIDHGRKRRRKQHRVINGKRKQRANQFKVDIALEAELIEPKEPSLIHQSSSYIELLLEHGVHRIEQFLDEQMEELFLHAALVDAFLAHEFDLQLFLEVLALRG